MMEGFVEKKSHHFFFSSRRRHTRSTRDWSSDVCSSDLVIERTELIKQVWPDSDGADGSLAVTVSALRKTLGDRPDGGPYIETVPRQGYRFARSEERRVGKVCRSGGERGHSNKKGTHKHG